jgi:hypothetical protein
LTGAVEVDLGNQHALVRRADGTVAAWGVNFAGQANVPPILNGVTAISAGGNHNLVITARPVVGSITPPVLTAVGGNVTLTVTATGAPLSHQWRHNGTNLPAGTNASLTIRNAAPQHGGAYEVLVTNPHGYNLASTFVSLPPPTITAQPQSRTVYRGEVVTFGVSASGFAPFTYQWFQNGSALTNETNATLVIATLDRDDAGTFKVEVTDLASGKVMSTDALLTVIDPRPHAIALRPVVDTSIFSARDNPQGVNTILSGTRQNGIRDRGLLRFELPFIPTNAVFETAALRLTPVRSPRSPTPSVFHLHRVLRPWGPEATWQSATSTTLWTTPGGAAGTDYVAAGIPGGYLFGSGHYVFGVTNELSADIAAWLHDPSSNHGWFLITDAENSIGSALHFGSSESENPPELFIRYSIPAPAPTIAAARRDSTNFVFEVQGSAGWFYHMQTREDVDHGLWAGFTNAPAGAGLTPIVITVPMTNSHQFFRAFRN